MLTPLWSFRYITDTPFIVKRSTLFSDHFEWKLWTHIKHLCTQNIKNFAQKYESWDAWLNFTSCHQFCVERHLGEESVQFRQWKKTKQLELRNHPFQTVLWSSLSWRQQQTVQVVERRWSSFKSKPQLYRKWPLPQRNFTFSIAAVIR